MSSKNSSTIESEAKSSGPGTSPPASEKDAQSHSTPPVAASDHEQNTTNLNDDQVTVTVTDPKTQSHAPTSPETESQSQKG